MRYVSLHHHSTFSYMDGFGTPEQHVERAAELGMSALALTEHGNTSSHVRLEKSSLAAGIKPIFGLEAYTGPVDMRDTGNRRKWHLTLLAMNQEGYHNLNRLVTRSWAEGFYQWPTVTGPMLVDHHEGLIVLSGCSDSKLNCDLLGGKGRDKGDERDATRTLLAFKELLGDRFYLEVQQFPELARTRTLNPWLAEAARRHRVGLVATADVHYPHANDNEMQVVLHAAGRGVSADTAESGWEYGIRLTLPETDRAIRERLQRTGLDGRRAVQAVRTTGEIAERCNVTLPKADRLRFPLPAGYSDAGTLVWDWLRDGWEYRAARNPRMSLLQEDYVKRLHYEMDLIQGKDFLDYFLMLSDCVRWAKDRGIPVGPARGSAAASLVCYLLRITEIDPLQFPVMMFERFIDVNRADLPDIDLDFDDERRDELRLHLVDMYGADRVGNIGTFTKYRGKNALIDVARVHNIPVWEIEAIKSLVVTRSGGDSRVDASLEDTISIFPQAQEVMDRHPDLWKAVRLEGNYRGMSVHAAGLVVSNDPLNETVAVYTRESNGVTRQVVSVDKYDAEYVNLLKADFLGLSTMGAIKHALRMIGMTLDELYQLPLDDLPTIDAFRNNDVTGIFQFTGGSTRIVCGDVRPDTFSELVDINALSRPGPLHSGSTNDYIQVKHGRMKAEKLHPIVTRLTMDTKGQIIYQEQILAIIREMGGLPWTHIQEIRKIISLKKGEGAFNERKQDFIDGCGTLHSVNPAQAVKIWNKLVTAGQYAFNAAHCVSYSMLAYWCMWLKVHHPAAFYASHLRKFPDEEYRLLRDARKHDISVMPPDLARSEETWNIIGGDILAGFMQMPNIGDKTAKAIMEWRDEQPADRGELGWGDLLEIRGIGQKTVEKMAQFCSNPDPFGITRVERVLDPIRTALRTGELAGLPRPTHRGEDIPTDAKKLRVLYLGIPRMRNPQNVIEDERARTGADMATIRENMKRPDLDKKMAVECYDDTDRTVYLRFPRWTFPKFEEALWDMRIDESVLLIRGEKRGGFGTSVHVDAMWVIEPDD